MSEILITKNPHPPVDNAVLLCIDLVLPMGWVSSPKFFFSASETVANKTNSYALDPASTFMVYPPHRRGVQDR